MQFPDIIIRGDEYVPPHPGESGGDGGWMGRDFSDNRFLNDRILRNTRTWPSIVRRDIPGTVFPERYILCFNANENTPGLEQRFRLARGGRWLSASRGFSFDGDTAAISVADATGRMNFLLFEVDVNGWIVRIGNEGGWDQAPFVWNAMGLIKTSPFMYVRPPNNKTVQLPRFSSGVRMGWNVLGGDLRGSVGQPYGRTVNRLRTYTVEYRNVHADTIDEYFERVGTTVPHWIVPYPEDVGHVPPIWGTLAAPPDMRKRAVNNWYWDLRLTWQEAY